MSKIIREPLLGLVRELSDNGVLLGLSLPMPSTTSWRAEIDGKRFSGMIEIDDALGRSLQEALRIRQKVLGPGAGCGASN
jgi:hypothetical protein